MNLLFQVIEQAMKTKWLGVMMVGWVTEYAYGLRAKNNLSCGDVSNYNLTIRYAIINIYLGAKFWNTGCSCFQWNLTPIYKYITKLWQNEK